MNYINYTIPVCKVGFRHYISIFTNPLKKEIYILASNLVRLIQLIRIQG
jgi:hypothetical protein